MVVEKIINFFLFFWNFFIVFIIMEFFEKLVLVKIFFNCWLIFVIWVWKGVIMLIFVIGNSLFF